MFGVSKKTLRILSFLRPAADASGCKAEKLRTSNKVVEISKHAEPFCILVTDKYIPQTNIYNFDKMDNYEDIASQLERALEMKEEPIRDSELILSNMNRIASKFNYNIIEARDNLRLKEQETSAIKNDVKSEKKLAKLYKSNIESKLIQLKEEINQLTEANRQMEEQLSQKDLPLILKLMGSLT